MPTVTDPPPVVALFRAGHCGCPVCVDVAGTRAVRVALVESATARLDADRPDWFRVVDPATLRLASTSCCVLGQVYGSYFAGLRALYGGTGVPVEDDALAFTSVVSEELWVRAIQRRLVTTGTAAPEEVAA